MESLEPRLCIPECLTQRIIRWNHDSPEAAHPGVAGTCQRILVRYYWPEMRGDVARHVERCVECHKFKPSNVAVARNGLSPRIPERFEVLSVDLVGPFPVTEAGHVYIFTVMDVPTGFLELFPMVKSTAEAITQVLTNEVFLRFGFPKYICCDNGPQFLSSIITQMAHSMGIQYVANFHPQANPVERKHRDLKQRLAIAVGDRHDS